MITKKYFMTALLATCAITTTMEASNHKRKDARPKKSDVIALAASSGISSAGYLYCQFGESKNFGQLACTTGSLITQVIAMKIFWSLQANKKKSKISHAIDAGLFVGASATNILFSTSYAQSFISNNNLKYLNSATLLGVKIVMIKNLWELTQDDVAEEETAEQDAMILL